jgi:hypothetical protein
MRADGAPASAQKQRQNGDNDNDCTEHPRPRPLAAHVGLDFHVRPFRRVISES